MGRACLSVAALLGEGVCDECEDMRGEGGLGRTGRTNMSCSAVTVALRDVEPAEGGGDDSVLRWDCGLVAVEDGGNSEESRSDSDGAVSPPASPDMACDRTERGVTVTLLRSQYHRERDGRDTTRSVFCFPHRSDHNRRPPVRQPFAFIPNSDKHAAQVALQDLSPPIERSERREF